jgi:hypothetical protein
MRDDRTESRLLLAMLRERWDDVDAICRRDAPDAEVFVSLARSCDVHPRVHALLESAGRLERLGARAAQQLGDLRRKCRNDNLLLIARLEQALDALLGAGIVPVALKGVDVLHRFSLPFDQRTLDDVDFLVRPNEFPRALEVLESAGWKGPGEPERTHWLRSSYEMPLTSPGPVGVAFELHWDLAQRQRYRIDIDAVFERLVPLDVAGRSVLRLDDHDAVAHLLLHHVQHYFDRRLKWTLDMDRIIRHSEFRWETAAKRLSEWGGLGAAGMALIHLRKLFPESIPERAVKLLPAASWRRGLTAPFRSGHPLDLFRGTRRRPVQLYLAAMLLEKPADLPAYLRHRAIRDRQATPPSLQ